jgi:hypothetical protein
MNKQIFTSVDYDTLINDIKVLINDAIPKQSQTEYSEKKDIEYISRKDTASLLNISIGSVTNYIKNGKLKTYEICGTIRLKKSEVLSALKNKK